MSKEEFLKIQTCVLKVNIHCDGCKHEVKKILQKIDGVYTTNIDSEHGKVTVSGIADPATLIKKLAKNGKHAEIWGAAAHKGSKGNQNQVNGQLKNLQIGNGKGGKNKGQIPLNGGGGGGNQMKGGGPQGQNPVLKQLKGFQDLKMPPQFSRDLKLPAGNKKPAKFIAPEADGSSEEEDYDFDDEFDEDEDDFDDVPVSNNKMKPGMGNGGKIMPNMMTTGSGGKKSGGGVGGNAAVGGNDARGGGGASNGKKGGGGSKNGVHQIQGGGKDGKNGGGQPQNGGAGGSGAANGNNWMANVAKRGPHSMPNMNNFAAVQDLPATAMNGGGGGCASYFPDQMAGNPYYQQQLAAMMMNQQRANGNERFQPMMYAPPPTAVNYAPPYPPYPYPPPPGDRPDQYAMFSDENTSSCAVM